MQLNASQCTQTQSELNSAQLTHLMSMMVTVEAQQRPIYICPYSLSEGNVD